MTISRRKFMRFVGGLAACLPFWKIRPVEAIATQPSPITLPIRVTLDQQAIRLLMKNGLINNHKDTKRAFGAIVMLNAYDDGAFDYIKTIASVGGEEHQYWNEMTNFWPKRLIGASE